MSRGRAEVKAPGDRGFGVGSYKRKRGTHSINRAIKMKILA